MSSNILLIRMGIAFVFFLVAILITSFLPIDIFYKIIIMFVVIIITIIIMTPISLIKGVFN